MHEIRKWETERRRRGGKGMEKRKHGGKGEGKQGGWGAERGRGERKRAGKKEARIDGEGRGRDGAGEDRMEKRRECQVIERRRLQCYGEQVFVMVE